MGGIEELISVASNLLGEGNFITLFFVLVAGLGYLISHYLLLPLLNRLMLRTKTQWDDIFDHLLAAAPFFGLRVFQNPSGHDFSSFKGENKQASKIPLASGGSENESRPWQIK